MIPMISDTTRPATSPPMMARTVTAVVLMPPSPPSGGGFGGRRALKRQRGQPPGEPGRQPPGAGPEQAHRSRDYQAADDQRVKEHGHRQAEAELPEHPAGVEQERGEDHHH